MVRETILNIFNSAMMHLVAMVFISVTCVASAQENKSLREVVAHQYEEAQRPYLPDGFDGDERWKPGLHYNVLLWARYPDGYIESDKVEVLELTMYTSRGVTKEFRSDFDEWLKRNSNFVNYVREPAIASGMPHAQLQARMFFTLEHFRRSDLHGEMGLWVKVPNNERVYHKIWKPDQMAVFALNLDFAKSNGIDALEFSRVYHSDEIDYKVRMAQSKSSAYMVNGTPTFVINRRFSVSPQRLSDPRSPGEGDMENLISLLDYLVRSELHRKGVQGSRSSNHKQQL